jgi:hypothetical protein
MKKSTESPGMPQVCGHSPPDVGLTEISGEESHAAPVV